MTATSQTSGVSIVLPLYAALFLSACMAGGGTGSVNDTPPARENEDSAGGSQPPVTMPTYYAWMSPEIKEAWSQGYTGQALPLLLWMTSPKITVLLGNYLVIKKCNAMENGSSSRSGCLLLTVWAFSMTMYVIGIVRYPCRPASSTRSI